MKYAVFDWDYTLREGYTLFRWIDYICEKKIISSDLKEKLAAMQCRYDRGEISHDVYADLACIEYALAMKGISEAELQDELLKYMKIDETCFFPFTETLFQLMYQYDILPIVITGAPLMILQHYAERFHLHAIYAFEAELSAGVFTGRVQQNCGSNKAQTMQELMVHYNAPPLLAFGDSSSDLPLLLSSVHPICIHTSGVLPAAPQNTLYLSKSTTPEKLSDVLKLIEG